MRRSSSSSTLKEGKMNTEEFVDLVRRMRRAQLDYYRDRTYGKLVAAKDLERQVDSALRQIIKPVQVEAAVTQTSFLEANDEKQNQ